MNEACGWYRADSAFQTCHTDYEKLLLINV